MFDVIYEHPILVVVVVLQGRKIDREEQTAFHIGIFLQKMVSINALIIGSSARLLWDVFAFPYFWLFWTIFGSNLEELPIFSSKMVNQCQGKIKIARLLCDILFGYFDFSRSFFFYTLRPLLASYK